jgi:3-oxoacyl-[acyl-carrier-protein] synthase-3
MINFKISGTGVYIPKKIVKNDDFKAFLDTNDEWITERTGIKERRIATDETCCEMAVEASRQALSNAKLEPNDIDMVILSTATSEYRFPSLACLVQNELGLTNAFCFDITAACTGFIYALDIAAQYFNSGRVKNVLVVASEKLSSVTDYTDRGTCILFGDAASAVVLSEDDTAGIMSSYLKSDGIGASKLIYKNIQSASPWENEIEDKYQPAKDGVLIMDGKEVYKFAVKAMCESSKIAMELAGVEPSEISAVLPHQANIRIIKSAIAKLGIDEDKYYSNIQSFGNTSSASIPLLLHEVLTQKQVKAGDLVLMSGFGAGLTYGAMVLKI